MNHARITLRIAATLVLWAGVPLTVRAAETASRVECEILYETAEGIYVDAGDEEGLVEGRRGWMEHEGRRVGRFEIAETASGSSFLRMLSRSVLFEPVGGERVILVVVTTPPDKRPPLDRPGTLRDPNGDDGFIPLLSPLEISELADVNPSNAVSGKITLREVFQASGTGDRDYSVTHLRSSGSIERLDGTPWAFEWSGDVSYRFGDGLVDTRDHEEPRFEAYRFSFFRRFDDRSFVRVGRFVPLELPSAGFFDGVQGEKSLGRRFRLGSIMGFKPARDTLDPTVKEIALTNYASFELESSEDLFYSATVGVLGSFYEGTPDRLAVLADQRARLGALDVFCSSEVDFDIGGADATSGTRLTRLDLFLSYPITDTLTMRVGADRHEIPDTEAERQAIRYGNLLTPEFFDIGYWRYWSGLRWKLSSGWTFDGDASFYDSKDDDAVRWSLGVTRVGLPSLPGSSATLTLYNLDGVNSSGFGARLWGSIPLCDRKLFLHPSIAVRVADYETDGATFFNPTDDTLTTFDVALRAHWRLTRKWSATGGVSVAVTDEEERFLLDVGVTYRF